MSKEALEEIAKIEWKNNSSSFFFKIRNEFGAKLGD